MGMGGLDWAQGIITHPTDNLDVPIRIQCMCLDWGKKPSKHRENMQAPHTQGRGKHVN